MAKEPLTDVVFEIGPDKIGDIRQLRSYFAVQLERDAKPLPSGEVVRSHHQAPGESQQPPKSLMQRIADYLMVANAAEGPVTDIYVVSHGWHRNYYAATSAYDRLTSRYSRLLQRGVLKRPDEYHPLILGLHWHSDPGEDGWIDPSGRRGKDSFLQNVETAFIRPASSQDEGLEPEFRFTTVFEDCFEYFSRMSAADTCALSNEVMTLESFVLAERLQAFDLRDMPEARPEDKVAAVWTCYHESTPKQAVADQETPPARGMTAIQALVNFVQFVIAAAGLGAILGVLFKNSTATKFGNWLEAPFQQVHDGLVQPFLGHGAFTELLSILVWVGIDVAFLSILAIIGWGILTWKTDSKQKLRRGVPFWTVVWLVPLETLCLLPALLLLFFTYFFSKRNDANPRGIFAERIGERNKTIKPSDAVEFIATMDNPTSTGRLIPARRLAARRAVEPLELYKETVATTNPDRDLFAGAENMLAFYEMQARGTVAGRTAAQFLYNLVENHLKNKGLCTDNVRIHLVGHSFGGLVVLNCSRHLALDETCRPPASAEPAVNLHSITLLQAAVGSNWFEGEVDTLNNIKGKVGCVYSAYDTANSFYYPVACGGRYAAGYVGLCAAPNAQKSDPIPALRIPRLEGEPEAITTTDVESVFKKFKTEENDLGLFALLVKPPDLKLRVDALNNPQVLNLDASRIVYAGPVTLGGGHTDIYKDDIINMIWAVSQI